MRMKIEGKGFAKVVPDESIDTSKLPERLRRNIDKLPVPLDRGHPDWERLTQAYPRHRDARHDVS